jgi:predicted HAD superfamily Cof-like phosphohydrolase
MLLSSLEQTKEFMDAAKQAVPEKPEKAMTEIETRQLLRLRLRLMFEELKEFATGARYTGTEFFANLCREFLENEAPKFMTKYATVAVNSQVTPNEDWDLEEMLDALCDMRVVNDGTILALGFSSVFNEALTAVHENNMSKFITDEAVIHATAKHYDDKKELVTFESTRVGSHYAMACKDTGGKLKKPHGFVAVSLTPFIERLR